MMLKYPLLTDRDVTVDGCHTSLWLSHLSSICARWEALSATLGVNELDVH